MASDHAQRDSGFTLIELMVVVLIIAILLAIAIPTFLGARASSNARSAQSNLRNALTAEQIYYTNNQQFDPNSGDTTAASVQAAESSLTFVVDAGGTTVVPGKSVLLTTDSDAIALTVAARSGMCYSIEVINQSSNTSIKAGTYYEQHAPSSGTGNSTTCAAPTTLVYAGTSTPSQANASSSNGVWSLAF